MLEYVRPVAELKLELLALRLWLIFPVRLAGSVWVFNE
jgi:hypothetical protein